MTLLVWLALTALGAPSSAQSCGEIGGDYCSQSGSCPAGYDNLGYTYDCSPCCQQGPSCGAIGGNWCNQGGGCPSGYDSLGQTYDCNHCCVENGQGQGQMSFSVYNTGGVYQNLVYATSTVIDNSTGCDHINYSTTTTLSSPFGSWASGVGGLGASVSMPFDGFGNYTIVTEGTYRCSCVGYSLVSFGGGSTQFPVSPIPTSLKLLGTGKQNDCALYLRYRNYEVLDQFGAAIPQVMTVSESFAPYTANTCNFGSIGTRTRQTSADGRFGDDFYLNPVPSACVPLPGHPCPSCTATAQQTIRVTGYAVGTYSVTWRCDDATIVP